MTGNRVTTVVEGTNADLIAAFARLYIRPDDTVMDVTYGEGVFWRKYRHPGLFVPHDLALDRVDFRHLPEAGGTVDVVLGDPPHIAPGGQAKHHPHLQPRLRPRRRPQHPAGVFDLYAAGMKEWARATRPGGLIAVKCSNGVTSGKRRWAHHRVAAIGDDLGLDLWDEFVLVRKMPGPATRPRTAGPRLQPAQLPARVPGARRPPRLQYLRRGERTFLGERWR